MKVRIWHLIARRNTQTRQQWKQSRCEFYGGDLLGFVAKKKKKFWLEDVGEKKKTRGRERGRGVYLEKIREERDKCYRWDRVKKCNKLE